VRADDDVDLARRDRAEDLTRCSAAVRNRDSASIRTG
jgi:hypothetical protein